MMPNNFNFVLQGIAMNLPILLASSIGLVMVSIFRQRALGAATMAMWCLIAILGNTILGAFLMAAVPMIAGNIGGENLRLIYGAMTLGRQLIHGAALVGLVYAVFQERTEESDKLPQLEEWSDRR